MDVMDGRCDVTEVVCRELSVCLQCAGLEVRCRSGCGSLTPVRCLVALHQNLLLTLSKFCDKMSLFDIALAANKQVDRDRSPKH